MLAFHVAKGVERRPRSRVWLVQFLLGSRLRRLEEPPTLSLPVAKAAAVRALDPLIQQLQELVFGRGRLSGICGVGPLPEAVDEVLDDVVVASGVDQGGFDLVG